MASKFEIFLDRKKQYRFHLKAGNGEIIAASEAYETKAACLKGIKSIQKNAPKAIIIDPEAVKKTDAGVKSPKGKKGSEKAGATNVPCRGRNPKAI
jgi:uncharacterized protein YegP (UPF0339 family)